MHEEEGVATCASSLGFVIDGRLVVDTSPQTALLEVANRVEILWAAPPRVAGKQIDRVFGALHV